VHLLVGLDQARLARRHQRAGRTGLHAFAAGDAGRLAHRIIEVEHDLRMLAAERVADDVVDLLLAAGAHAARALDAGVEVDRDAVVRQIGPGADGAARSAVCRPQLRPSVELRVSGMALSGMSESRSSSTIFCDATARALSVVTSMPGAGLRQHEAASTRSPLTSTTQARQLPSGRMPSL
jgi:hypothetical protein